MWTRRTLVPLIVAPLIVAVMVLGVMRPAVAQVINQQDGPALFAAGEKALGAGNFKSAVRYYSRAMRAESMPAKDISKALLRRGVAHRQMGKAANAIADLNSALWLGDLPPLLKARAHFHRGLAYREVGMSDRGGADLAEARKLAPGDSVIAKGIKDLGSGAVAARRPEPSEPSFSTSITGSEDDRPKRRPRPPAPTAAVPPAPAIPPTASVGTWTTSVDSAGTETPATENKPGRARRFWDGLWGSSQDKEAEENREQAAVSDRATPDTGWQTSVGKERANPGGGLKYRLQLASVKSEDEAQQTWAKLSSRHKDLLGGREPTIEKTDLGSLGTFYRLQIGPFADKGESLRLCNSFKRSGINCFLITR